jgi:hypothetical protein
VIVHDPPRSVLLDGRYTRACRVASTLPGPEGTAELEAFRDRLGRGIAGEVLDRGRPRERLEVLEERLELARLDELGASSLTCARYAHVILAKQRALRSGP